MAEVHVTHQWAEATYTRCSTLPAARHQVRKQVREAATVEANVGRHIGLVLIILKLVLLSVVLLGLGLRFTPLLQKVERAGL